MSEEYQVIARKYRPSRFAVVVGQQHVVRTLMNAVREQRQLMLICWSDRAVSAKRLLPAFSPKLSIAKAPLTVSLAANAKAVLLLTVRAVWTLLKLTPPAATAWRICVS